MAFKDKRFQIKMACAAVGCVKNTIYKLEKDEIINPIREKTGKIERRLYNVEDLYSAVRVHQKLSNFPCRVQLFANNKGGVGKTTISTQYTFKASFKVNKPILYIDLDPQAQGTKCLGLIPDAKTPNMRNVLIDNMSIEKTIIKLTSMIHIIPSHLSMSRLDMDMNMQMYREEMFVKAIAPIKENYSLIVVDTNPSLSTSNLAALNAADEVYLISDSEHLSLEGINNYKAILDHIANKTDHKIKVKIIPNKMNLIRSDHKKVYTILVNTFGEDVLNPIRMDSTFSQAQISSDFVYHMKPKSNASDDLTQLTTEILNFQDSPNA